MEGKIKEYTRTKKMDAATQANKKDGLHKVTRETQKGAKLS